MKTTADIKPDTAHTPEPWNCDGRTTLYATPDESGEMTMIEVNANITEVGWDTVAFIEAIWPGADANARRICAAVNACAGLGTDALMHGAVGKLLEVLERLIYDASGNQDNPMIRDKTLATIETARSVITLVRSE